MYVLKLGGSLRGTLKPLHKRLGLLTILMGMATISVGVQEKADKGGLSGNALQLTYAIGILVYATLGGTVFTIAKFEDKADGKQAKTGATTAETTDGLVVNVAHAQADETTKLI